MSLRLSYFSLRELSSFERETIWEFKSEDCSIDFWSFSFTSLFSCCKIFIFSSFSFTILFNWDTSLTGESTSLRLSYFSVISFKIVLRSWFSVLSGSNNDRFSDKRLFSCFKASMMESFCLASFRMFETSLTGDSISLKLSYFSVISLTFLFNWMFSCENTSWLCKRFSNFWTLKAKSLFSCFKVLFSESVCFNNFLIWETSLIGESASLRLSYFVVISSDSFNILSFSSNRFRIFSVNSALIIL